MELSQYLENKNAISAFKSKQEDVGGIITFSNSGKRGSVKYFSLGLKSFSLILKDIKTNLNKFAKIKGYEETPWRDMGNKYYTDEPANAMSTVQTKPLFSTISKIIAWANYPLLEEMDTDQYCPIELSYIDKAILKIDELIKLYYVPFNIDSEQVLKKDIIILESNTIRDFALLVFKYFYNNDWKHFLSQTSQKPSTLGNKDYISHDFSLFNRLIAQFDSKVSQQDLTSSNTQRYFVDPIYTENNNNYYFTTQWNAVEENGLSFNSLKKHFEESFTNFKIISENNKFQLIEIKSGINKDFKDNFHNRITDLGLKFSKTTITRFISSLLTKPFVILTGLSGSGKTKLAQAFAQWICEDEKQYCIVPVGADWTNREPLLGFPNALQSGEYVKPDNKVLDLIIDANAEPDKPYFLILDEMNLSHVERYFADFLSVMESKGTISLHPTLDTKEWNNVPAELSLPKNLFIIGTVNIDETTYMFSPKVLDRANVIEFRVTYDEMKDYFDSVKGLELKNLVGKGANMAESFVQIAKDNTLKTKDEDVLQRALLSFFTELKKTGAEFGYRSASEIMRFAGVVNAIEPKWTTTEIIDVAIMQKLLPKVHGSRRKLEPVLRTLGSLCLIDGKEIEEYISNKEKMNLSDVEKVLYPISLEKVLRMYQGLIDNGFTSYAEA